VARDKKTVIRGHIKTVVNSKKKRLVAQFIVFVIFLLIWALLMAKNVSIATEISASIAIALMISIITTLIEIIFNLYSDDGVYQEMVNTYLRRQCLFCKTSLEGVYNNRDEAQIGRELASCAHECTRTSPKEVKILVTNLESIVAPRYFEPLKECIRQGVKVKVCTIDPRSAEAFNIYRVTGGDNDPELRFFKMKNSLKTFVEYNNSLQENKMDIRTYTTFPTMILFIIDNSCFLSFLFHNTFARNALHIQFNLAKEKYLAATKGGGTISAESFEKHFDDVFANAVPTELQAVLDMKLGHYEEVKHKSEV